MRILICIHAILMLLASTSFTMVTALIGESSLQWCYYLYSQRSGFGHAYISDFTLPVVLTYMAAFAIGIVGFSIATMQGRRFLGSVGVVLSVIGFFSFALEGSHWLLEHYRSWIAICPAAMLVLAFLVCLPRQIFLQGSPTAK